MSYNRWNCRGPPYCYIQHGLVPLPDPYMVYHCLTRLADVKEGKVDRELERALRLLMEEVDIFCKGIDAFIASNTPDGRYDVELSAELRGFPVNDGVETSAVLRAKFYEALDHAQTVKDKKALEEEFKGIIKWAEEQAVATAEEYMN